MATNGNGLVTIERLNKLLPKAVLLPIPERQKGPKLPSWQNVTFAATQEASYRKSLIAHVNTGVLLGQPSENLCAIDIDSDDDIDLFLALNPCFRNTLRSKGKRGCQFWFYVDGDYPHRVVKLKDQDGKHFGEFRADGGQSVIRGIHPEGVPYELLCDGSPLRIGFNAIIWPTFLILPWKTPPPKAEQTSRPATPKGLSDRMRAYLEKVDPAISGQDGHGTTLKAACALVWGFGLDPEEAFPFLSEYNARCQPPWNEKELRHKLNEALKVPHEKPRGHLLEGKFQNSTREKEGSRKSKVGEPKATRGHQDENGLKQLIQSFGLPGFQNAHGKLSRLSEPFWAQLRAREEIGVFEPDERQFYRYSPEFGLFVPQSEDSIRKELSDRINRAAFDWGDEWFALQQLRSAGTLAGIITHLRGEIEQKNFFTTDARTVHLANCVLRFRDDGTFVPEQFSPQMRSRNRSPILYDPNATCPDFEKSILGHVEPDDRELLQKYGGQCLLGRNITQRITLLDGEGEASKSAYVQIVRGIVGPSNVYELRTRHLEERFEIGRMVGKTLLLGADVRANFMAGSGASRLKALVGGDTLEAERKGSNQTFSVDGSFNVLITSNSRLRVHLEGDQSAWKRRLAIARYDKPFTGKKIPDIHERLLSSEGSGILNWFLEGTRKLIEDISKHGDIALSQRQKDHVESLLLESDSLRLFIKQSVSRVDAGDLAVSELVEKYMKFCSDSGWSPIPVSVVHRQLDDILLELFAVSRSNSVQRQGKAVRGYRGLRFRLPTEEEFE